jgi:hypothetical protein
VAPLATPVPKSLRNSKKIHIYGFEIERALKDLISSIRLQHGLQIPRERFFQKSETFGLRQTNLVEFFEAFGIFSAKLSSLFWHCESLVHGKMYLVLFPTKNFGFQV